MNDTYESILEAVFAEDSGPKRKSKARAKGKTLQKTQSEILKAMLALETDDDEQKKTLESLGVEPNYAGQINLNVVRQAAGGDMEAIRYIRDTIGEKPRNGFDIGNLDDKPFETIDLTSLTDSQLKALAAKKWRGGM